MEAFVRDTAAALPGPAEARARLMETPTEVLAETVPGADLRRIWRARLARVADWFVEGEAARRARAAPAALEIKGKARFEAPGGPFELVAKADRIDLRPDGTAEIVRLQDRRAPDAPADRPGLQPAAPPAGGDPRGRRLRQSRHARGGCGRLYRPDRRGRGGQGDPRIDTLADELEAHRAKFLALIAAYDAGAPYLARGRPHRIAGRATTTISPGATNGRGRRNEPGAPTARADRGRRSRRLGLGFGQCRFRQDAGADPPGRAAPARGHPARAILCLTYTKAAAAEMQNRLFAMLGEWALADDAALGRSSPAAGGARGAEADAERLAEARRLFAMALETPGGLRIQTIHAFCDAVLRRFPLEAGVSPRFEVMDERPRRSCWHACAPGMAAEAERAGGGLRRVAARLNEDEVDALIRAVLSPGASFPARHRRAARALFGPAARATRSAAAEALPARPRGAGRACRGSWNASARQGRGPAPRLRAGAGRWEAGEVPPAPPGAIARAS